MVVDSDWVEMMSSRWIQPKSESESEESSAVESEAVESESGVSGCLDPLTLASGSYSTWGWPNWVLMLDQ